MPLVREHGRLEDDDRACEHPSPCETSAVARVPNPVEITAAGIDLCPYHLALWADTRGSIETLRELDVADLAADDRWLSLDAAPPRLEHDADWHRLGVDHQGLAHYYQPGPEREEANCIATVDQSLDVVDTYGLPPDIALNRWIGYWIEYVNELRGWVALEDNPLEDPSEAASK
jgi:hypothetical protein